MKEWKTPEVWELSVGCTKGAIDGNGEDHIRVTVDGHKEWGNNPSA